MNVGEVVLGWRDPGRMVEPTLEAMANRGAIVRKKEEKTRTVFKCLI